MKIFGVVVFLCSLFAVSHGHKIAIFTLDMARSQIVWSTRVAEELVKAGHNVTLIRHRLTDMPPKKEVAMSKSIHQWFLNTPVADFEEQNRIQQPLAFKEFSFLERQATMAPMFQMFAGSCAMLLQNKEFLEKLKSAKFELAFAHNYELCPIGLIHYAKIPTWIWLNDCELLDYIAEQVGVPSPSSYVPGVLQASTDEMSFFERAESVFAHTAMNRAYAKFLAEPETEAFRKYIDPEFPSLMELARDCPLVMVNSNEMYSLPRPTLHKVVYIGGLGMTAVHAKPLPAEFKEAVDKATMVAVMTFGSHANTSAMPEEWKSAFMNTFRKFPHVTFFVRYTTHDLDALKPPNVHFSKWVPQTDLLHHEKTRVLITHGGYNSLQEAIHSRTPLILIPLFLDQPLNAKLAEKQGLAYVLQKSQITEGDITKALNAVLGDNGYQAKVDKMHDLVRKKPSQPEKLLVEWTEFLAEFQRLDNLVPYGTKLSFVQYFCLDVFAAAALIVILILLLLYKLTKLILKFLLGLCSRSRKQPSVTASKRKLKKH